MTTYQPRRPTFSGIQWTGSNMPEVSDFVAARHKAAVTYSVEEDGMLIGRAPWPFSLFVPQGHHVIYGPTYGDDVTQAGWSVKTPDEVAAQFEPVP